MSVKTVSLLIFIILLLPLITTGCLKKVIKGPAILFEKEIVTFGEVAGGEDAPYSFFFSNPGTEILIIDDLHLSCWCITVDKCDRVVEPGAAGVISGVIKTAGLSGDIVKTITVKTNIPNKDPILSLEGNIIAKNQVEIIPLPLVFGEVKDVQTTLTGEVVVRCLLDLSMRIIEITTPGTGTEAQVTVIKKEKEYRINITVHPPLRRGIVDEVITLHTNSQDIPEINVPYTYHTVP
jgi:hypothetical protein